jgi:hypothetical protein
MRDDENLLTKAEEDALLQCSNFYDLLDQALGELEQEDYHALSIPLRDIQAPLHKLVTMARADIYAKRLRAINERLDKQGNA